MRALCTGDNHLGAGPDLGRTPGDRLAEQEQVWRRSLEIAREEDCDVVLHGGDLFHKARPTPEEVLAALRPLVEHVEQGGCPVVMALGNHERSGVSEATMPAALAELEALYVSQLPEVAGDFDGVTICCLPWVPSSWLVASRDGGDRDHLHELGAELLVQTARGLREQVDGPAILVTHFSISGAALPNGLPVDQLREPVLEWSALDALGFDAVVAGHIHAPQVFGRDETPGFYVGSPMPLNFGEADTDHGVWILERDSAISGTFVPRFVPVASTRLETVDFDGYSALQYEVAEALALEAIVKARVHLSADDARRFDAGAFRRACLEAGAEKVFLEIDVEREERQRVEGLSDDLDELQALDLWLSSQGVNGERAASLRERTEQYLGAVR